MKDILIALACLFVWIVASVPLAILVMKFAKFYPREDRHV